MENVPSLYDIARLHLTATINLWKIFTPFLGAAAFCTTTIGDFKRQLSRSLSSLGLFRTITHTLQNTKETNEWDTLQILHIKTLIMEGYVQFK